MVLQLQERTLKMSAKTGWDTTYEWKAVALLSLGFGLVGLDRFMILPMFPSIMQELNLSYGDLGLITGILSIAWGVSALFMGRLADRVGPRSVIIAAMVAFSILVGASGLATGLVSLMILRAMMGLADGAYTPPSIIATLEASRPSRHGLNLGIQQMMLPLFGLGLAPIIVTQLLHVIDWRWIFPLVSIPASSSRSCSIAFCATRRPSWPPSTPRPTTPQATSGLTSSSIVTFR